MGRPVIVLGDATDHGGRVIGGDMSTNVDGKPIARVGDMVSCPKCKGTFPIIEGVVDTIFSTQPVAVHGHKTACGATLIGSQTLLLVHVAAGNVYRSVPAPTTSKSSPPVGDGGSDARESRDEQAHQYDMHFLVQDKQTGQPLRQIRYKITLSNGKTSLGYTDDNGLTQTVSADSALTATIEAPYYDNDPASDAYANCGPDTCNC
ncbi:PAAR domain-containing protein [Chitinimonas taiwanensis]|uniref:Zn-binding Pro-Ala-Ala-Arg (PAAR) domain-containing protein, incolved in TypeVI secretion n=1 Tax=Chitinimonas taiwanensis DSM 18899 TaxID=1121279 RepID=A0A1K2HSI7_9NEIS|nr:PAAR domain-containing protein [Chitinimonas taiwanensis]SFZ79521.1 Zn-binding Pro-Ala-Ala-Arg (PAAR) domain-containing protein, incolved in TypeVI secretion [Chitinimonas taiwanensis DSM 18899]